MGSCADDGTSGRSAFVRLGQYVLEQVVVPRYMRTVGHINIQLRYVGAKTTWIIIIYPFWSLGRGAAPGATYPRRLPIETTRRQGL